MDRAVTIGGVAILGIAILLLGIGVLTVFEIARDPSARLSGLQSQLNVTSSGPTASFTWVSEGYNVTFTDTSTDNSSTITSWVWDFGDGTGYVGRVPPTHRYDVSCPMCTENVTLGVTDASGRDSAATTSILVQRSGGSSGSAQSTNSLGLPKLNNFATELPAALELLLLMFLIGGSVAKAGWNLVRHEPETVPVLVHPPRSSP